MKRKLPKPADWYDKGKKLPFPFLKTIEKAPLALEGTVRFPGLARVRAHLFGDVFLIESRCDGCPGKGDCVNACSTGYLFSDEIPDVWHDMPCSDVPDEKCPDCLLGHDRPVFLVHVYSEDKTYLSYRETDVVRFIFRYVLGWKWGITGRIGGSICNLEEGLRVGNGLPDRALEYRGLCSVKRIPFSFIRKVGETAGEVEDAVTSCLSDMAELQESYHLGVGDIADVRYVKGQAAYTPFFMRDIRRPLLFGKSCPKRDDGVVGDDACLVCAYNEFRLGPEEVEYLRQLPVDVRRRHLRYTCLGLSGRNLYISCTFNEKYSVEEELSCVSEP